jgi:thymidylate synthase ThyX
MEVRLAGFNLDAETIRELTQGTGRDDITPETLSAAYARISRDPRPPRFLRKIARREVARARRSNRTIVFGMGHHSIAEHAVFNFDLMDISRLAIEEIESFRLCSYTEKSQRYVALGDDYILPRELLASHNRQLFTETIHYQNQEHRRLYMALSGSQPPSPSRPGKRSQREEKALEDSRYLKSLATPGQLGLTLNARNLELIIRRFASHPLAEIRGIGYRLYRLSHRIAPSLILFADPNPYDRNVPDAVSSLAENHVKQIDHHPDHDPECATLCSWTSDADDMVLTALLHRSSTRKFTDCHRAVGRLSSEEQEVIVRAACHKMQFYDAPPREFEYARLVYELVVSASCFAQLKRHRMMTLTAQQYDPSLGVAIPPSVCTVGMEDPFMKVIQRTNAAYEQLRQTSPEAASYVLTNAYRRKVLVEVSARELYHISRLREDTHAQWEIRGVVGRMVELAREVMPITMLLIGGKDRYEEIYRQVFGTSP